MNSRARTLTTLTIFLAAAVALSPCAQAKAKTKPKAKTQPSVREKTREPQAPIKGEHISQLFAAACAENTFAEYHAWALKNHFLLRQFDSPTYQISPNEIKDDELGFAVTINDQNKWQAKLRDQTFTGDDPCDLANAYLLTRTPKQITLWTLIVPEVQAQKLVNEATATNWLLGAIATAAVTEGAFIDQLSNKFTLSNSHLLAAAFRAANTAEQRRARTNFDKLLAQRTELICSRNRIRIYGKDLQITVKKGYIPFRIGVIDNLTGKPINGESQILQKGKVYDHLLSLGQRCNHDGDAQSINAQIQAERDLLNMKIARAARLNRSISSVQSGKSEK